MNINVIGRTDQSWFAKIGASGKKRVESLEVGVVRVVIAAGNVRFETESGFERSIFKCEPNIRRCCPRLNVATAEAAELVDEFKVVVPTGFSSPNPRADGVPDFVSRALVEVCVVPIQSEVVKVNIPPWQPGNWSHSVESPKILIRVGIVIEHARLRSHRLHGECVHPPATDVQDGLHAVEAQTHIRSFTGRDKPRRAVSKLLAACTESHGIQLRQRNAHVEERLVQINIVPVSGSRSAIATIFKSAFELSEDSEIISKMGVGMNHVALEQIAIVILRPAPPETVVIILVALPDFAARRQIPISVWVKRNEFHGIEVISASRWVAEILVVFVVAKLFEGRRACGKRRIGGLAAGGSTNCHAHDQQPELVLSIWVVRHGECLS